METTLKGKQYANTEKIKRLIVDVIIYFFVILFVFIAYDKIRDFQSFKQAYLHSLYISDYSTLISGFIIAAQIIITVLLIVPYTARYGLMAIVGLLMVFNLYLGIIMITGQELPCECGSVSMIMSWKQHIWFNFVLIGLSSIALKLYKKE